MKSIYDLKIFIQSNPQQELAAKVSSYSFKRFGFKNIEILHLNNIKELKDKFNKRYLRSGKKIIFKKNDLQSFTLIRFLPPKIFNDFCLIIDPDVFAVKNPAESLKHYIKSKNNKIFCTKKNDKFKSEVYILNCKNFDLWNFDKIIDDLFTNKLDYQKLINFEFLNKNLIGELECNFNVWDKIDEKTILLHTTNRITQPWKEDLNIDFKIYTSKINFLKNYINKILGRNHNSKIFEKKYKPHPNMIVSNFVENIFKEAYINNYINYEEILYAIANNYISKKFIKKLKL